MRLRTTFLIVVCSLFLFGCASSGVGKSTNIYFPDDRWWVEAKTSQNKSEQNLAIARLKMQQVSSVPFLLGVAQSPEINAYAVQQNEKYLVIFTNGYLQQFGQDQDVLAFTLGHELAHHQLGHTEPGRNQVRDTAWSASSQALGMLASYFVPFSGFFVGNAVKAAGLSFNRDDERAADELGMKWVIQAGYSACGEYRLAKSLDQLKQGANIPFLSTHPGNGERMEVAKDMQLNQGLLTCDAGSAG